MNAFGEVLLRCVPWARSTRKRIDSPSPESGRNSEAKRTPFAHYREGHVTLRLSAPTSCSNVTTPSSSRDASSLRRRNCVARLTTPEANRHRMATPHTLPHPPRIQEDDEKNGHEAACTHVA